MPEESLKRLEQSLKALQNILEQFPEEHKNKELLDSINETYKEIDIAKDHQKTTEEKSAEVEEAVLLLENPELMEEDLL